MVVKNGFRLVNTGREPLDPKEIELEYVCGPQTYEAE
jgi:hypothetical protein